MISLLIKLFEALAAIPSILKYIEQFAQGIMHWYVRQATRETHRQIADAAAYAARAQTEEERYEAAEKWQAALRRPRVRT